MVGYSAIFDRSIMLSMARHIRTLTAADRTLYRASLFPTLYNRNRNDPSYLSLASLFICMKSPVEVISRSRSLIAQ